MVLELYLEDNKVYAEIKMKKIVNEELIKSNQKFISMDGIYNEKIKLWNIIYCLFRLFFNF